MLKAEKFYVNNPEQSLSIVSNALSISPEELQGTWDRINPEVRLDHSVQINLEEIATWAVEGRFVKDPHNPDTERLLVPSFLEKVDPERVGLLR